MTTFTQKLGGVALIGVLTAGCGGREEAHKTETQKPTPYTQIDKHTFVLPGSDAWRAQEFGESLAAFRNDHTGDFLLIPTRPEYPFWGDVLAVEASVPTKGGGQNTVHFVMPGSLGK